MDLEAVAAAIAVRYAALTPPAGEDPIAEALWELPDAITTTPVVLVFPPDEEMDPFSLSRSVISDWPVRFYLGLSADLPRVTARLMKWRKPLLEALDGQVHLGLSSYVANSGVFRSRIGRMEYPTGGAVYAGIELGVRTVIYEPATYVA